MKLAVPLAVATVSPLQCTTLKEDPMQGPHGAAPITSVAPHPCSQRPYGISCAAVLDTEGSFALADFPWGSGSACAKRL